MAFLNPLMLWGLAAASVPIVIHLLNRRRFTRQKWAAMEWLLRAAKQNQKRLRVENLLLLALRTLAVLLLALALARPTFSDSPLPLSGARHAHLFLLVDNSASMGARSGTRTALEEAVTAATSLLAEIADDDPVTLVVTNDNLDRPGSAVAPTGRARVLFPGTRNHANVRDTLGKLRAAPARADLADALKALEQEVPEHGALPAKVAILSDLQAVTVDGIGSTGGNAAEDPVRAVLTRLREKKAEVILTPVGRRVDNVAIVSLTPDDDRDVVQGNPVVFVAEVANFSDRPAQVEVRFLVDGQERGRVSRQVPLPPRPAGNAPVPTFRVEYLATFSESDTGFHTLEASLHADALPVDDTRSYAFHVRDPIRVLAVDGDPSPGDDTADPETYWIAPALSLVEGGPFSVSTLNEADFLAEPDLTDWDLVILANVARPAPDESAARRLRSFVTGGGALLLTVGNRVIADVWNKELYGDGQGGDALLPAKLGETRLRDDRPVLMDLGENDHPILREITHPDNAAFFPSPHVYGFIELENVAEEASSRVVMTYSDLERRAPAMIEKPLGRGRVLLLTTTVDGAWERLPSSYVFPALLHETVYFMTAKGNARRNLLAYQPYMRSFPRNFREFSLVAPDGSRPEALVEQSADTAASVNFRHTDKVGVYETVTQFRPDTGVLDTPPPPVTEPFAVNMTPWESDTRPVSPEELTTRWRGLVHVADSLGDAADAVGSTGGEIWKQLLVAALLCLLGESLLARRIGRRRTRTA